jgi:hypothetical protein
MKRNSQFSFNVAYCGIMCALAVIVIFLSIIPALNYVMPAIAGLFIWSTVPVVASRPSGGGALKPWQWGILAYAATSILAILLAPEIESKTLFILFFGYFPLIREKLRFGFRFVIFNGAAVSMYFIVTRLFGVSDMLDGLEGFAEYAVYILWAAGNLAFIFYDFALKHVYYAFSTWIKPALNKKIK